MLENLIFIFMQNRFYAKITKILLNDPENSRSKNLTPHKTTQKTRVGYNFCDARS